MKHFQTKEDGFVDQEVFNAALEEYKKASHLKKDAEETGITRSRRSKRDAVSLKLEKLAPGRVERPSRFPKDTVGDYQYQGYGLRFKAESTTRNIRDITISGIEGLNLTAEISGKGTRKAILKLTGKIPTTQYGIREYALQLRMRAEFNNNTEDRYNYLFQKQHSLQRMKNLKEKRVRFLKTRHLETLLSLLELNYLVELIQETELIIKK